MNTHAQLIGLAIGIFAAPLAASAVTIYKVTDAQGHVTYQNEPPARGTPRVEIKQIDPNHNTLAFERPRAIGAPQGGGAGGDAGNADTSRAVDELIRRSFMAGAASAAATTGADAGSSVVIVNGGSRSRPLTPSGAPDATGESANGATTGTTTTSSGNVGINGGTLFENTGTLFDSSPGTTNPNFGNTTTGTGTSNQPGTTSTSGLNTNPNGASGTGTPGGAGTGTAGIGAGGTTGATR